MNMSTSEIGGVADLVDRFKEYLHVSLYDAAIAVRNEAQTIIDAERQSRIAELRKRIDERKDAEKELASLKPVGHPRKPRAKRAAKGLGVDADRSGTAFV